MIHFKNGNNTLTTLVIKKMSIVYPGIATIHNRVYTKSVRYTRNVSLLTQNSDKVKMYLS